MGEVPWKGCWEFKENLVVLCNLLSTKPGVTARRVEGVGMRAHIVVM